MKPPTPRVTKSLLSDTFGRFHDYLRISLTERCNLRCQYCMPSEGVDLTPNEDLMTTGELLKASRIFRDMGVKKIRLTGGEPLIRKDFDNVIQGLGELDLDKLCITTNGIKLSRKIPIMKEHGVTHVNISLDTLVEAKYQFITRRNGFEKVFKALHQSIDAGLTTKVNCVVMRGQNDDEVVAFANLAKTLPIEVRFIEYMPFNSNSWSSDMLVPWMSIFDSIEQGLDVKLQGIQGQRGDVSKRYSCDDWVGSVGFITTMTSQFCGGCNRMRLLADGQVKVCLFDSNERSILQLLRTNASDIDVMQRISEIVDGKQASLGGHTIETLASHSGENRPMVKIGG